MKVYIAGPMRGYDLYNFPEFDKARDRLAVMGINSISPADLDREAGVNEYTEVLPPDFMQEALRRDIEALLQVDGIVLLNGWEASHGVVDTELPVARSLGLKVWFMDYPWPKPATWKQVDQQLAKYEVGTLGAGKAPASGWDMDDGYKEYATAGGSGHYKTDDPGVRQFESGATRNSDSGKFDFEGFLSPLVLMEFGRYMHGHRFLEDGSLRDSDNWQKGIPKDQYIKSLFRHFMDLWLLHRGYDAERPENGQEVDFDEALAAIIFNAMGYWHELLIERLGPCDCDECVDVPVRHEGYCDCGECLDGWADITPLPLQPGDEIVWGHDVCQDGCNECAA